MNRKKIGSILLLHRWKIVASFPSTRPLSPLHHFPTEWMNVCTFRFVVHVQEPRKLLTCATIKSKRLKIVDGIFNERKMNRKKAHTHQKLNQQCTAMDGRVSNASHVEMMNCNTKNASCHIWSLYFHMKTKIETKPWFAATKINSKWRIPHGFCLCSVVDTHYHMPLLLCQFIHEWATECSSYESMFSKYFWFRPV